MAYPGNPSLSSDVQKRILGTFEQTLGLAAEGSRQEALLGCDFVLRMDPHFAPARTLQERLDRSAGPVQVDDLLAPAASSPPAAAPDPFAEAGGFGVELPDLPDLDGLDGLPDLPPAAVAESGGGDLSSRFASLLDGRSFAELTALAQQNQEAVGRDPELMRIASLAQERMEASPYVEKFLSGGREAARQGDRDEVARAIEKIRALDPSHPGLAELEGSSLASPAVDAGFELSLDETPDFGASLPDLGFAAEAPELSFDTPTLDLAEPEPPAAALAGGDSESDRRIQMLLDEGQAAFEAEDLQGAIDAWSRIFLIDIDHQEAAARIERARKLKAESERQAEEIYHDALAKAESGNLDGAKQALRRVLEIQPGHFAARDSLQQLEQGKVPVARPARDSSPQPSLPLPSDLNLEDSQELKEEILVPPDPSEIAAAERSKPRPAAPAREGRARRLFLLVGSAVLVLVLAGSAFVYLNRDRLFPNSQPGNGAAAQGEGSDPIARAMDLHRAGKTQIAVSQLRRVAPEHPQYQEAQVLISQWERRSAPPETVPAVPAVTTPETPVSAERLAKLDAARQAYSSGSFLKALEHLEQASAEAPLEPAEAELLANARRQVESIAPQLDLFRQNEWEHALRDLWRLHEADPGNRDVTKLMVDSYYNLGLRDLQRMDSAKAAESFREALGLDPDDREVQRQLLFAQTYQDRNKDLLYRIYVKHLPLR